MNLTSSLIGSTIPANDPTQDFLAKFAARIAYKAKPEYQDYLFYNNTVRIRYDIPNHKYYLVTATGLELQENCSSVSHIIDKSEVLIPWACKMMEEKFYQLTQDDRNLFDFPRLTWGELDDIVRQSKTAHKDKLEEAGNVGHIAHDWIEQHIKRSIRAADRQARFLEPEYDAVPPPEDERAANAVYAAWDWMDKHKVRWLCTERKVYSRLFKYAGTMDGLCLVSSCDNPGCCEGHFTNRLSVIDWKTSNYLYPDYILQISAYLKAYVEETGENVTDCWLIRLGKTDAKFDPWHLTPEMISIGFQTYLQALDLTRSTETLKKEIDNLKQNRARAKKELKATNLKLACKNSKIYKGVRLPQCNDGAGCAACWEKYRELHPTDPTNQDVASCDNPKIENSTNLV